MDDKTYDIKLNVTEFESLTECLKELRKKLVAELGRDASEDPIFVSSSQLAYKLGKIRNPESTVTLNDYFDLAEFD